MAEDLDHAKTVVKAFEADYGAQFPRTVAKITDDAGVLMEFYNHPAEHWVHLRTTNPIETTFATVRLRTKIIKGPGPRAAGVAMAFKLIESAKRRRRSVNAHPQDLAIPPKARADPTSRFMHRLGRVLPAEAEAEARYHAALSDPHLEAALKLPSAHQIWGDSGLSVLVLPSTWFLPSDSA